VTVIESDSEMWPESSSEDLFTKVTAVRRRAEERRRETPRLRLQARSERHERADEATSPAAAAAAVPSWIQGRDSTYNTIVPFTLGTEVEDMLERIDPIRSSPRRPISGLDGGADRDDSPTRAPVPMDAGPLPNRVPLMDDCGAVRYIRDFDLVSESSNVEFVNEIIDLRADDDVFLPHE